MKEKRKITAGADGGGTVTTLVVLDERGALLERKAFGPLNLNSMGETGFLASLREIFSCLRALGECRVFCIGAAGLSNPAVGGLIKKTALETGFLGELLLKGDHEIALYGAMGGGAGSILIAGTGSICTGRTADGEVGRAGGWGHLIGDEGSGYAMGRDALAAVVRAYDGRGPKTVLSGSIAKAWNITSIGGLIKETYSTAGKAILLLLCLWWNKPEDRKTG